MWYFRKTFHFVAKTRHILAVILVIFETWIKIKIKHGKYTRVTGMLKSFDCCEALSISIQILLNKSQKTILKLRAYSQVCLLTLVDNVGFPRWLHNFLQFLCIEVKALSHLENKSTVNGQRFKEFVGSKPWPKIKWFLWSYSDITLSWHLWR